MYDLEVAAKMQEVLISKEQIKKRIKELAVQITKEYNGEPVIMICILRGAFFFFADLVKEVKLPVEVDFMSISSYCSSTSSTGEVKILKDLNESIIGKNVIIVEDIIDSGFTLRCLKKLLLDRNPKSLKVCTLLDKVDRRVVDVTGDYTGFVIPDAFVVGYGLDYAEQFRTLDQIYILKPEVYEKK